MKRWSLGVQVFASVLLVALGSVVTVGLIARNALSTAFDAYLAGLPTPSGAMAGRPHMGRAMLGAAESTFVASVDNSVYLAAFAAVAVTAVVALLLARYLVRPISRLEAAAEELAGGDLSHRVHVDGPAEVAALGDAFNRMADSLEQAEELRRRMAADVSHELRNPLAAARAQAEGMAEGVLLADTARLGSLADDLRHLSALVDDLQELSVADAGRLRYEFAEFDLATLLGTEVERAALSAPAGVSVSAKLDTHEPVLVDGDELRLSQVIRNLLDNALRHTDAGTVTVRLGTTSDGDAEVRVADTGQGIPDEDLPFVFERFYRADAARAAHTGGAGLGLAIAGRIVADHGGHVFAEHNEGGGAVVGFTLPAAHTPRGTL